MSGRRERRENGGWEQEEGELKIIKKEREIGRGVDRDCQSCRIIQL